MDANVKSPLRQLLREQLAPAHAWLETSPIVIALFDGDFDRLQYQRLLWGMKSGFCQIEQHLRSFQSDFEQAGLVDFATRNRKCERLDADLKQLRQMGEPALCFHSAPGFVTLRNFSAAAGALYVLEGSTQGARRIAPLLEKRLGADLPLAFYRGEGEATDDMWQTFCQWLDQAEIDPHEAVLSGMEVFVRLRQQLLRAETEALECGSCLL
jgi:heme oxygenase